MAVFQRTDLLTTGYAQDPLRAQTQGHDPYQWAPHILRGALEGNSVLSFNEDAIEDIVRTWLATPEIEEDSDVLGGYRVVLLPPGEDPDDGDILVRENGRWVGTPASLITAAADFRGPWAAFTAYKAGEMVLAPASASARLRGRLVAAVADVVTTGVFAAADWRLAEHDETFAGAWQANTDYTVGQVVVYLGHLYSANADFTSGVSFVPANWTPLGGANASAVAVAPDGTLVQNDVQAALAALAKTHTFAAPRAHLRDDYSLKDYITSASFVSGDEYTSELAEAIADTRSKGKGLLIPDGRVGVSAQVAGAGSTSPIRLTGQGPLSRIEYTGTVAPMIFVTGSIVAVTDMTAPAALGQSVISCPTAGLAPGDLLYLRDPTQPILGDHTVNHAQVAAVGQMRVIREVNPGAGTITVYGRLSYNFTAGSDVLKITPTLNHVFEGVTFTNPVPGTLGGQARIISLSYAAGIGVRKCEFRDLDAPALSFTTCWNLDVGECGFYGLRDYEGIGAPYSVLFDLGSQFWRMYSCWQHYDRHLVSTGHSANGLGIPTRAGIISACIATGTKLAGFDTHAGAVELLFDACKVMGTDEGAGFQVRGPDCTLRSCEAWDTPIGFRAINGADRVRVIAGLSVRCGIGLELQDVNDPRIDMEIDDPITNGVVLSNPGSVDGWPAMTRAKLRIHVRGNPSGAAFDFQAGGWNPAFDIRRGDLRAPDAATPIAGMTSMPATADENTLERLGSILTPTAARTEFLLPDGSTVGSANLYGRAGFPILPAPADVIARKLRIKVSVKSNATAPGTIMTVGLYPITAPGGASATAVTGTVGAVVPGSSKLIEAPGAVSPIPAGADFTTVTADFDAPAPGTYAIGVVVPAAFATNAAVIVKARLVEVTI